jgi:hypothetical protein
LRRSFGGDFGGGEAVAQGGTCKAREPGPEGRAASECRKLRRRGHGLEMDQINVTANRESRQGAGQRNGFVQLRPPGHHAGGGDDAVQVGFGDGPVDARGQTEIIGVDDEALHPQAVYPRRAAKSA